METLKQSKNFITRELKITKNKVFYRISKYGNSNEVSIPFEDIEGDVVTHKSHNVLLLGLSVFFAILPISLSIKRWNGGVVGDNAEIIWASVAFILLLFYLLSRQSYFKIKLTNNNFIFIHEKIPNRGMTQSFVDSIITSRNTYLKDHYANIDPNVNYETQLNNLRWLESLDVLSKTDFDEKYEELKNSKKTSTPSIGFKK